MCIYQNLDLMSMGTASRSMDEISGIFTSPTLLLHLYMQFSWQFFYIYGGIFFYFVTIVIYVFFWCFYLRHVWHIHRSGTRIYQTFMAYSVNMPLMSEIEIPLREKPMGKTPQQDAICRACCIKKEKSH